MQWVMVAPAFDPYVVGSPRQLDEIVLGPNKARVSRPQGWISPVLVVDGRIVGIWTGDRRGDTLSVTIEPFGPLARPVRAELAGAADRVAVASGATGADVVAEPDPI
jgi:DNA glycosylase AlkZ-like